MNTIKLDKVPQSVKIVGFADVAMWLNLTERELVEELLETFTDFTDFDIVEEIIDTLNLPIICVIEPSNNGDLFHGYINQEVNV